MKAKVSSSKTVLTIVVGFLVVFILTKMNWAIYVSIIIGLLGVFSDYISDKMTWLWMKLAFVLSFIVPNIILSIVFFFFLFPIGLLYRVFRKSDPFKIKKQKESMFIEAKKEFNEVSFERMF